MVAEFDFVDVVRGAPDSGVDLLWARDLAMNMSACLAALSMLSLSWLRGKVDILSPTAGRLGILIVWDPECATQETGKGWEQASLTSIGLL